MNNHNIKKLAEKHHIKIDEQGELLHGGALAVKQNYAQYTEEDHRVWEFLFKKQFENLQELAYIPWLTALDKIGLHENRIPKFIDLAERMDQLTGWIPVPIQGFLDPYDYFVYLSKRQFPTVVRMRSLEDWEFQVEPDLFHDAFGHLPMHSDPILSDFVHLFGKVAAEAKSPEHLTQLTRLYWYTVEYGLIRENGKIKVCGSGHLSGFKEARYSLSDSVEKRPFNLEEVVKQDYNPHVLQTVLFVMESYEQLFESMKIKAKEFES